MSDFNMEMAKTLSRPGTHYEHDIVKASLRSAMREIEGLRENITEKSNFIFRVGGETADLVAEIKEYRKVLEGLIIDSEYLSARERNPYCGEVRIIQEDRFMAAREFLRVKDSDG